MAKLTDMQRLARVLEFIAGLSHPEVRAALNGRGFSQHEADEGFRLLREALEAFYAADAQPPTALDTIALLDAWENRWLPVVAAALERHDPKIARSVLLNIQQTRGPRLLVTLPTLLDRIEALGASAHEPERRARSLLTRRGLTSEVIDEARTLLRETTRLPMALPLVPKRRKPTLDSLWSWYREWSRIARVVIQDRRLLRSLGFGKPSATPR